MATGTRRGGARATTPNKSAAADSDVPAKRSVTRLTADLPTSDSELLGKVADDMGTTKVTALSRAIRILARLTEGQREGQRVILESPDGSRTELFLS